MTSDLEKKLLGGTAYRIFCDELSKHLAATETLFCTAGWTEDQLKEASGRFHTIRGGAGFFKLTAIATLAGQLETMLNENSPAALVEHVEKLREIDLGLRRESSSIPAPVQS